MALVPQRPWEATHLFIPRELNETIYGQMLLALIWVEPLTSRGMHLCCQTIHFVATANPYIFVKSFSQNLKFS
jgi:hypothetical protein